MEHLLHRFYGVDAPVHDFQKKNVRVIFGMQFESR